MRCHQPRYPQLRSRQSTILPTIAATISTTISTRPAIALSGEPVSNEITVSVIGSITGLMPRLTRLFSVGKSLQNEAQISNPQSGTQSLKV